MKCSTCGDELQGQMPKVHKVKLPLANSNHLLHTVYCTYPRVEDAKQCGPRELVFQRCLACENSPKKRRPEYEVDSCPVDLFKRVVQEAK